MEKFSRNQKATVLAVSLALVLAGPIVAFAATTPSLGTVSTYGIVSSTWTNSLNTGLETAVNGDVCYTTAPDTAPISINGVTVTPLSQAVVPCANGAAQADALTDLNLQACTSLGAIVALDNVAGHLTGVYTPGCYSSTGAMNITLGTTVTLDGPGTYIFRSGGALSSGDNSRVVLINGASASDVFWTPTGLATIGANSATSLTPTFVGNIIADALGSTGITIGHFANVLGRALAFGHTVTTDSNTITVPTTLRVVKVVSGGTAVPADFSVNVKLAGVNVSGSPANGAAAPGTLYTLSPGTYVVSETANASYTAGFSGDCDASGSVALTRGQNKTCTITNTFVSGGGGGGGSGGGGGGGGGSFAALPLINVQKVPSPLSLPGGAGSVAYTYTATNIGPVAMHGVWVRDNKCSPVGYVSGDSNDDSVLDINESWVYRCTKTVSQTETNTATAHGQANGWDAYDTANATVVVGVPLPPPLIHLVKKPSTFVLPAGGGAVTYMYAVTNPGTAPLSDVSVIDDKCTGLPGRVAGHPGDLNKDNLLESNETWTFTCQTNLTQTTTNIGTAEGHANGLTAIDFSPATVVVAAPGLPNTGLSPEVKNTPWDITLLAGILVAVLASLGIVLRKRAV